MGFLWNGKGFLRLSQLGLRSGLGVHYTSLIKSTLALFFLRPLTSSAGRTKRIRPGWDRW